MVKSPLMDAQVFPKSVDLNTTFDPKYTVFLSCGEATIGAFQLNRYFNSFTGPPSFLRGCGLTSCWSPVFILVRTIPPP